LFWILGIYCYAYIKIKCIPFILFSLYVGTLNNIAYLHVCSCYVFVESYVPRTYVQTGHDMHQYCAGGCISVVCETDLCFRSHLKLFITLFAVQYDIFYCQHWYCTLLFFLLHYILVKLDIPSLFLIYTHHYHDLLPP
jgi:hypothetical protein